MLQRSNIENRRIFVQTMLMRLLRFAPLVCLLNAPAAAEKLGPLITIEDYPSEALRNGWQGDVTVDLTISPDGRVTNCSIVKSSGHQLLDDATCHIFRRRSNFPPGHDAQGRPIETHIVPDPVGWHIYPR